MKEGATRLEENVLPEDQLSLLDGRKILNVEELIDALEVMSEEQFEQNNSKSKGLLSEWINESYGNECLAKKLKNIKKKNVMIKLLNKAIKNEKKEQEKLRKIKKIKPPRSKRSIIRQLQK